MLYFAKHKPDHLQVIMKPFSSKGDKDSFSFYPRSPAFINIAHLISQLLEIRRIPDRPTLNEQSRLFKLFCSCSNKTEAFFEVC